PESQPPPPPSTSASPPPPSEAALPSQAILDLQTQLRETQNSLASQLDKIRTLEAVLAEQESMKNEVRNLRDLVEVRQREVLEMTQRSEDEPRGGFDLEEDEDEHREEDEDEEDDDDDARSVSTLVPHELESVEEEDEEAVLSASEDDGSHSDAQQETERREQEAEEAARRELLRREKEEEVGRPGTPEPIIPLSASKRAPSPLSQSTLAPPPPANTVSTDEIKEQIIKLSQQVGVVVKLTSTLEAQHVAAQSVIKVLEEKVESLEGALRKATAAPVTETVEPESTTPEPAAPTTSPEQSPLTERITEWMKNVEGKWATVQEEWKEERERLGKAREEWERRVRMVDSGLERLNAATNSLTSAAGSSSGLGYGHPQTAYQVGNGDVVKLNGLVTPPSPRSQSSDSGRYRRRRRRAAQRSQPQQHTDEEEGESSSREPSPSRSRSRSRSPSRERGVGVSSGVEQRTSMGGSVASALALGAMTAGALGSPSVLGKGRVPSGGPDVGGVGLAEGDQHPVVVKQTATPESSVYYGGASGEKGSRQSSVSEEANGHANGTAVQGEVGEGAVSESEKNSMNVQTALGVLLLSVAAAAVIWKVKPE
ncbi:hypothetical protein EST38_g11610, partial [Candolleomyces aberdarensis]